MKHRWLLLNEWLKAFILAFAILILLHVLVVRWVTVQSTSMYATLLPGDLLLVQRWAVWTGFDQGDVVVFRDPLKDGSSMVQRPLLVKRIAGMPGDVVELKNGELYVNDVHAPAPPQGTSAYLLRMRTDEVPDSLLDAYAIPRSLIQPGRTLLEVPLNERLAAELEKSAHIISASPMSPATGAPRHIFPFSQYYRWNSDDLGPIRIPAKGDTITINERNLPLYDRLISRYEGHTLSISSDTLLMDGLPLKEYVIEQDYYFMLGDSRHHSADSRYWGFVPHDHMVGKGIFLLLSAGEDGLRSGRSFMSL